MKHKLIPNYIYFYHLDKFCVLPIYPESITDALSSTFSQTDALSRTAPVFTYSHSGPRTITVNLFIHRDLMNDVNTNVSNLKSNVVDFSGDDYVDTLIGYLQAAALPKYNSYKAGSKGVIPPMVAVRFGDDIFIKGVITSGVSVTYNKPILSNNKYAKVDIVFTISEVDPYDAESVIDEASFRGISRTFKDGIFKSTDSSPTYNVPTKPNKQTKPAVTNKKKPHYIVNTSAGAPTNLGGKK